MATAPEQHLHCIIEDIDGMLVVAADAEVGVALDISARWRQVATHQLQKRALACVATTPNVSSVTTYEIAHRAGLGCVVEMLTDTVVALL